MLMRAQTNPWLGRLWLAKTVLFLKSQIDLGKAPVPEVTSWGALLPREDIHCPARKPSVAFTNQTRFIFQCFSGQIFYSTGMWKKWGLLPPAIKIPCSAALRLLSLFYFLSLPSESPLFLSNPSRFLDGSKWCKCNKYSNPHFTERLSDSEEQICTLQNAVLIRKIITCNVFG